MVAVNQEKFLEVCLERRGVWQPEVQGIKQADLTFPSLRSHPCSGQAQQEAGGPGLGRGHLPLSAQLSLLGAESWEEAEEGAVGSYLQPGSPWGLPQAQFSPLGIHLST